MATYTFVKKVGAPSGTINFDIGNNSYTINDTTNLTIVTTDAVAAADLKQEPYLTLQGVTGIFTQPPTILPVMSVDGVPMLPGPGGTYVPFSFSSTAQTTLKSTPGLVPVSGAVMALKEVQGMLNGTDNVEMSRAWNPINFDVHMFRPVWAGWMIRDGTAPSGGQLETEVPLANPVTISCAVETLDGRVYQLTQGGAPYWTVEPGGQLQCDPIDIDVHASDGGFWLRTHVQVKPGGFSPANRNVSASQMAGSNIVRWALTTSTNYESAILAVAPAPSLYWELNASHGLTDQSGNGRDGTGHDLNGALTVGTAIGPFAGDGATFFNGSADTVISAYNPYTNGNTISVTGLAQSTPGTAQTLFGGFSGGAATNQPNLRINSNGNVFFSPTQGTGATATWVITWPTTGWVHWAFYYNQSTGVAELFINGASQGTKTGLGAYDPSRGPFMIGGSGDTGAGGHATTNPFNGNQAHIALWGNYQLTPTNVTNLYNAFVGTSTDQTVATGALSTAGSTFSGSDTALLPILLTGTIGADNVPIVALRGDSITEGRGDSPDATAGWALRGTFASKLLSVKTAKGSERGQTVTVATRTGKRLAMSEGSSYAIDAYGVNDFRSPQSSSLHLAVNALLRGKQTQDRKMKTYAATIGPSGATSSDFWATLSPNQAPHPNNAWRVGYNNWLRSGAPVAAASLTVASALTAATLNFDDTSLMPPVGIVCIGGYPIFYTGKTSTTLTGCTPSLGVPAPQIPTMSDWPQPSSASIMPVGTVGLVPCGWVTTVAGSGQTLPLATITAVNATPFTASGTIIIAGIPVTYTGKTSGSFTGASGGVGPVGVASIQQDFAVPTGVIGFGSAKHPLAGYIEVADTIESSRDSGLWSVNGTANWLTADGVHPTSVAHILMSTAIIAAKAAGMFA